jgi:hypothetical protein
VKHRARLEPIQTRRVRKLFRQKGSVADVFEEGVSADAENDNPSYHHKDGIAEDRPEQAPDTVEQAKPDREGDEKVPSVVDCGRDPRS